MRKITLSEARSIVDAVRKDFPSATAAELQERSLDATCADVKRRGTRAPPCVNEDRLAALRTAAAATAAATAVLLLLIWWAGQRSRRDRRTLLNFFRPGTYAVMGFTLVIIVVDTTLFSEALAEIRIFGRLIVLAVLGPLIAVVQIIRLLFAFQSEKPLEVSGERLEDSRSPGRRLIGEVARAVGTEPPENIIVGTNPTFFVTEIPVLAGKKEFRGRSIYISVRYVAF